MLTQKQITYLKKYSELSRREINELSFDEANELIAKLEIERQDNYDPEVNPLTNKQAAFLDKFSKLKSFEISRLTVNGASEIIGEIIQEWNTKGAVPSNFSNSDKRKFGEYLGNLIIETEDGEEEYNGY